MNGIHPEYFQAAIRSEADRVARAAPSTRNDALNRAAFNLASLGIPGSEIIHALRSAALGCGLKKGEIYSTINSGMRAGKQHPWPATSSGHRAKVTRGVTGYWPSASWTRSSTDVRDGSQWIQSVAALN